ncbi:MAG: MFS transporter [Elusimicrobia bacterium]|nr:MFS transporter [Elusimicrobiota bacterium]
MPHATAPAALPTAPAPLDAASRWRAYSICLLGWLFDFYDLILFAYLAKAISRDLGWGASFEHNKGLLVGLALAASGVGGVVFGGLADRFGRRRVMAWTILIYCLGTGLCGLSTGLLSLALFRALTGFGVGGEWATGHALMAEIFPKEQRGRAAALLQAGEPLGVALAVLAGLVLEPRIGWRWVFFLSAFPAVLVVFIRRNVAESPLWLVRQAGGGPVSLFGQYRTLLRDHWRRALQAWILGCSKLGTYWLTYVWLPEYFAELDAQAHSSSFAGIRLKFILVAQGGQFAGMLAFGWLADRLGRRPAFTLYSLLTAAGLTALSLYGAEMLQNPTLFWPAMGAVGLGSGCTAGFGALLAELFPTSIRNTAMGTVYNMARGFQFVTQLAMASLAASAGVSRGLLLAVAFALLTAGWVWTFPETRGIALSQE